MSEPKAKGLQGVVGTAIMDKKEAIEYLDQIQDVALKLLEYIHEKDLAENSFLPSSVAMLLGMLMARGAAHLTPGELLLTQQWAIYTGVCRGMQMLKDPNWEVYGKAAGEAMRSLGTAVEMETGKPLMPKEEA